MDERDIYFAAGTAIRLYGDEAAIHAARRADEMLERGDMEGAAVWRRVLHAIEVLQRKAPSSAVH